AIIEVGLGGRLDATNVILPILSIITNVHFDHQAILGDTLEKIAFEKGGIIKPSIPVVLGEMREESRKTLLQLAKERNSIVFEFDSKYNVQNYCLDLKGNYQQQNLKTVLTAIYVLINKLHIKIDEPNLKNGLENVVKNTQLQGRWEKLTENPLIICDTAHNEDGIRQVAKQIGEQKFDKLHLVLGFVEDKDFDSIINFFPKDAVYYFCEPNSNRKLSIEKIKQKIGNKLHAKYFNQPKEALENAKQNAKQNDFIFVGGSNFVVAEIL
ncbi:MAG TPA: tetrahydrofolate synthase, partial [Flavobacterium sp.]|nr:tetrahydrofolate synthase [Flavobacterium sp.]